MKRACFETNKSGHELFSLNEVKKQTHASVVSLNPSGFIRPFKDKFVWIKTTLVFVLLFIPLLSKSQYADVAVLGSGLVMNKMQFSLDDKILHYYVGYFGEKSFSYLFEKKFGKKGKIFIPALTLVGLSLGKELIDKRFESNDIFATSIGCFLGCFSLRYNF